MEPIDIQYQLKKRQITQKQIADALAVSQNAISKVVNKLTISDRIMRHIADLIGRDRRDVFPEYYKAPPKRITSKVVEGDI